MKKTLTHILPISLTVIILFSLSGNLSGQNRQKLAFLEKTLIIAFHDSTKARINLEIANLYDLPNPDSALIFHNKVLEITNKYLSDTLPNPVFNNLMNSDHELAVTMGKYKVNALRGIGWIQMNKGDYILAAKLFSNALAYAYACSYTIGTARLLSNFGVINWNQGNYDKAIAFFNKALKIYEEIARSSVSSEVMEGKKGMSICYLNMGLVNWNLGNYDKSIEYNFKSLKLKEEVNDKNGMALCYMNIGLVHNDQFNYDKAINYLFKSIRISEELADKRGVALCYNNIGNVYYNQKIYDTALVYYFKSLKVAEEINNKNIMSICFGNIGLIYKETGVYDKALDFYMKDAKLSEELDRKNELALVYCNIAELYYTMADSGIVFSGGQKMDYYQKALFYGHKSLTIAKQINAIPNVSQAAKSLMLTYKKLTNFSKALEYAEMLLSAKDSMFKADKTNALVNAEAKFNTEKKQLEIDKLNKEKLLQQSELLRHRETDRRQRLVIMVIIAGSILIAAFAVFVIQRLRITSKQKGIIEKQKMLVDEKNHLLNKQNVEISVQRDEIEAKNVHLSEAYSIIEQKNKNITDSIRYALRIQSAIFPPQDFIDKLIPESFIYYLPKSIVSGDFYWLDQKDDFTYIAAVDCTGHGVPGAFMSIVGYNLLNQALNEKNILQPAEILFFLTSNVSKTLRQTETDSAVKDGMDLVVCRINNKTLNLELSSVHNSFYLVRNKSLTELKGEKWLTGRASAHKTNEYITQYLQLEKGDMIYLFSDGFMDQFSGITGKKLTSTRFKEKIVDISDLPVSEQKKQLKIIFENWKGNSEQIDDVMVLGIKINDKLG